MAFFSLWSHKIKSKNAREASFLINRTAVSEYTKHGGGVGWGMFFFFLIKKPIE